MMFNEEDAEELIRVNLKLTKENNKMLKAMRRDAWIGRFLKLLILVAVIALPVYGYYTYVKPQMEDLKARYYELQGNMEAIEEMRETPENFFEWLVGLTGGQTEHTATTATSTE